MSLMQACAAVLEEEPLPLRERCSDAPVELEEAVMRCLRKDPAQRFADISELARAIAPFGARYKHCAERSAELLADGQRRSDPGYRQSSDPAPLRRSDSLGLRVPTYPPVIAGDGTRPSMRFVPPPAARLAESSLAPALAPGAALVRPRAFHSEIDATASPLTEADLLDAEELELDSVPGLRPRKNRWILVAVGALTALSATYLAVRRQDSTESRNNANAATHVIRTDGETPSHLVTLPLVDPDPPVAPTSVPPDAPVNTAPMQTGASMDVRAAKPVEPTANVPPKKAPAPVAPRKPAKPVRNEDPDVGF
jgi:hypothetical protein